MIPTSFGKCFNITSDVCFLTEHTSIIVEFLLTLFEISFINASKYLIGTAMNILSSIKISSKSVFVRSFDTFDETIS